MPKDERTLSGLDLGNGQVKLERSLLKDRAADTLREHIGMGRIPEGTRLTEREVSEMLGISRMPVHDALMILEAEGLVVNRSGVRYVIELDEKDVRDLHVARLVLEREAAKQAAEHCDAEAGALLWAKLEALETATARGDHYVAAQADMALHQALWQLADNAFVSDLLHSLIGVISVLNDRLRAHSSKSKLDPMGEHRELVECVTAGDGPGAMRTLERHLINALGESLGTFRMVDTTDEASRNGI